MKRTIVVGNAPTLLLDSFGNKIDSYDRIIRINEFVIDGWETHVGTQTDIHVRAKNYEYQQRAVADFDEIWLKAGWDTFKTYGYIPYDDMSSKKITILKNTKHKKSKVSKSMGFMAIETAISKYYSEGNPISIIGFNLLNVKDNPDIIVDRPHYYKNEPPNVYSTHMTSIGEFNHDYILERQLIKNWINNGLVLPLFPDEIFNDNLDLSHLDECVRVTPSHLIGKINPQTKKKYK